MKKMIPNQLFNQPDNVLLSRKTPILMMKKLLLMFIFAFFIANVSAQERNSASVRQTTILKADQFFASLRNSADRNTSSPPLRVESLIKDDQPSVYALAGEVKTYGTSPVCLFTDVSSINTAYTIPNSSNIEIVTIRVSNVGDLNSSINVGGFSNFPKLKYIYIVSEVPANADNIQRLVRNVENPGIGVFYDILQRN
jgi:hypothetical protein